MDEIFEADADDDILSASAREKKRRVSFKASDDDFVFSDSLDASALDRLVTEQCDERKSDVDNSCPKTPDFSVGRKIEICKFVH